MPLQWVVLMQSQKKDIIKNEEQVSYKTSRWGAEFGCCLYPQVWCNHWITRSEFDSNWILVKPGSKLDESAQNELPRSQQLCYLWFPYGWKNLWSKRPLLSLRVSPTPAKPKFLLALSSVFSLIKLGAGGSNWIGKLSNLVWGCPAWHLTFSFVKYY